MNQSALQIAIIGVFVVDLVAATALTAQRNSKPPARPVAAASPTQRAALNNVIADTDDAIRAAEEESAKYSGGLVKSLIEVRLATLRQTRAMLAQRAAAADFNVAVRYTIDGRTLDAASTSGDIEALDREIADTKRKIHQQQAEADRYSGGLTQAMLVSALATTKHTLAMLEQKRLALMYSLPQFIGFADKLVPAATSSATGSNRQTPATKPSEQQRSWEIVAIDSRVTESNDTWWKFAWKLTIRNKGTAPVLLRGTIEFKDKDGFVVDDDETEVMSVPAGGEQTFTGYALVTTASARAVANVGAKVGVAR